MTEELVRKELTETRLTGRGCSLRSASTERPAANQREIPNLPRGSYIWVHSEDEKSHFGVPDRGAIPQAGGDYQELAKLLFKLNGCRPGPVRGWYVVVCADTERSWAVGQLCANAFAPVQVFEDMVYSSEADARARAISLRSNDPGAMRVDKPELALHALHSRRTEPHRREPSESKTTNSLRLEK